MTSAVLIIPAPYKAGANAVGAAMGWGPDNYTVPLSTDGAAVTHWACRTDVQPSFLAILLAAGYDLTRAGMTPEQIAAVPSLPEGAVIPAGASAVLAVLDVNLSEVLWGADHMHDVLAENGFEVWNG